MVFPHAGWLASRISIESQAGMDVNWRSVDQIPRIRSGFFCDHRSAHATSSRDFMESYIHSHFLLTSSEIMDPTFLFFERSIGTYPEFQLFRKLWIKSYIHSAFYWRAVRSQVRPFIAFKVPLVSWISAHQRGCISFPVLLFKILFYLLRIHEHEKSYVRATVKLIFM